MPRPAAPAATARPLFRPARLRAVGVRRISEVGDRAGPSFHSPGDQQHGLESYCAKNDYDLVAVLDEFDVSGYTIKSLHKRPGLGPAVAMIEAGEADILVLAYLDRLARNLTIYRKARTRIMAVGGRMEAADFGDISGGTASQRFSIETLIHVAEFFAEMTAEKTQKAKEDAIAAGIPTFDRIPFGYRKDDETRRLVVVEDEAVLVRKVFEMREEGSSLEAVRDWLRAQPAAQAWMALHPSRKLGIRSIQHMLQQRMYLGELSFGKLSNLHAQEPIVDPGLFRTVQGMRVARDTHRVPSDRLLARLGVARCAYCGNALVVGSQGQRRANGEVRIYKDYRCSNMGDCTRRVIISADVLETAVATYVRSAQGEGHASADDELAQAEAAYQQAEQELSNFITLLSGVGDLAATQAKLDEARQKREQAFEHWQSLRALSGTRGVRAADWETLSLSGRRALIRATIKSVVVSRGVRGVHVSDRIRIEPFTQ